MKATYGEITHTEDRVGGEIYETIEPREIFKDPITDDGTKKSKKGLLQVGYNIFKEMICNDQQTWEQEGYGLLTTVFLDGKLVRETNLEEIRKRLS